MDDEVQIGWRIDPEVRAAMRLDRARTALDRGEFDIAIMELEELLDEDPDHAEALGLLGDAQIEVGDFEVAAQALEHYLEVAPGPDARALSGLAAARLNLCEVAGALSAAREAVRLAPDLAEAHYHLGLALELVADQEEGRGQADAVTAFAAAHQLDPLAYPFPLSVASGEWQDLVQRALTLLPQTLQVFWTDLPILLLDHPDIDELRETDPPITPTVTGLFQGTPPEDEDPWQVRPTALRLYLRNLLRSPSRDLLVEAIAHTMEHEARDWLGVPTDEPL